MLSRKSLARAFSLAVLFATLGCQDKTRPGRAYPANPSSAGTLESVGAGRDRPLIGITSTCQGFGRAGKGSVQVSLNYVRAVIESGGAPVVLPVNSDKDVLEQYVRRLDGLVLIGGADIPPAAYGQKPHPKTKTMPAGRYECERRLIPLWLASGKPLVGICLGIQFVNVAAGGTLIQDIPTQVGAKVRHSGPGARHAVIIEPDSRLRKILGAERVIVRSGHHQAVKDVGRGLKVVARSLDGIVEAMEATDENRFCLLVQWHPERMHSAAHRKAIFGALVGACKERQRREHASLK